ncbi:MAG: alpha/beta hydrolase [Gemmatimonadaceae bacterium]
MNYTGGTDTQGIRSGAGTIDLQEEGSPGVLLLHGFGDTPQTLALLAKRLHGSGYSVLAPLLPGHGRSMAAFQASRAIDWINAARHEFLEMAKSHQSIAVVGLSMGGALAVLIAAEFEDTRAVVLIAPYLGMPLRLQLAASTHWVWGRLAGEINARNPLSIHDPLEREKNLAYGAVTGRVLFELSKIVRLARKALPKVAAPTLIIQSKDDPRSPPAVAQYALGALGSKEKKLVLTEGAGHIITVDYGRARVFSETEEWLDTHMVSGATAAVTPVAAVERPATKSDPERIR